MERVLQEIVAEPVRVRRLAGWEWIRQALEQLPSERCGTSIGNWY